MEKMNEKELRALRDQFAMNIVCGHLSNPEVSFHTDQALVQRSYQIANIMMETRKLI